MDYKKESVFWLMNNRQRVANDLSKGSSAALAAILALLEQMDGAKAFKEMTTVLTPVEWGRLYFTCMEEPSRIIPSVITINCLSDDLIVHKNLELKYPAQFAIDQVYDYYLVSGQEKNRLRKRLREDFIKRYNDAKTCQPK